jgi:hypothetical protein
VMVERGSRQADRLAVNTSRRGFADAITLHN